MLPDALIISTAAMMAAATKPLRQRQTFLEDATRTSVPCEVDLENGIIKRVKILGWESSNGRKYPPQVAKKAVEAGLYEGCKVYWDHPPPERRNQPRKCEEGIGIFRNVIWETDGVYGDLHYFRPDNRTLNLCEDCKRVMKFHGMSHHADCEFERGTDGVLIITEIKEVRSVDCVTDSATVANMWESRTVAKIKLTDFFEQLSRNPKLAKPKRRALLEMGDEMMPAEAEIDEPAAETDPDEALFAAFETACAPLVKSALSGDTEALKKLNDWIKTHVKLSGTGETKTADVEEEKGDDEEDDKDKKGNPSTKESKKRKANTPTVLTVTEADAKGLCEVAGVTATADVLTLMTGKTLTEARAVLALAAKARPQSNGGWRDGAPRTGSAAVTESKQKPQDKFPTTPEERKRFMASAN